MARRLGWFVGAAALVLVLARLGRVLEPAVDTPDWRLVVPVTTVGAALITLATARLTPLKQLVIHAFLLGLVVLRITASETLTFGVLPGADTLAVLAERLTYAFELLRFGAPPVLAVPGLTALATLALWAFGSVWAASIVTGRTWAGIVPALGFYLYLAVVDRAPASNSWNVAFALIAALGLVATSNVVSAGAGQLRASDDRAVPRWEAGPAGRAALGAAVAGLVGVTLFGGVVPAGGTIDWRTPGGEGTGTGSGGFSASRFASLRQSVVSLSDDPVFRALVEPEAPDGPAGYWRLLTLDRYTGEAWVAATDEFAEVTPDAVQPVANSYREITQTIQIESLSDDRLPSLFAPQRVASRDSVIRSGTTLGTDGNLRVNALTFPGLSYRVDSAVPVLDVDLLASIDGELTPLFQAAAEQGSLTLDPVEGAPPPRPAGMNSYLSLPPSVSPAVAELAAEVSADAASPFEAALLLEDFLRSFDYSTNVSTGHSALDLAAWLTDPQSPNYRTGYCEQFAAAMAVLGRTIGLPTRVVIGFTAGEVVDTGQGPVTVVRERNAHAWVEVWLDGQGWVGFDPTPRTDGSTEPLTGAVGIDPDALAATVDTESGQVAGQVPEFRDVFDVPPDVREGLGVDLSPGPSVPLLLAAGVVLALLLALPTLKMVRTSRRMRRARSGDITAAWQEITDRLVDLGQGPTRDQTPVEFAEATAGELLPLAEAYSAAVYGGRRIDDVGRRLDRAGYWVDNSFDMAQRTRAVFSLRSLRR